MLNLCFSMHLLADFRLGQSDVVVEIRRRGSDKKKEEADEQQSRAEAQSLRANLAANRKEEERESHIGV